MRIIRFYFIIFYIINKSFNFTGVFFLFLIKTEENRVKAKEAKLREDHQAASTKEFEIRQQISKYTNEIEGKKMQPTR